MWSSAIKLMASEYLLISLCQTLATKSNDKYMHISQIDSHGPSTGLALVITQLQHKLLGSGEVVCML